MSDLAVLLPHYKNIEGLRLTLDSMLTESDRFELFLIDDGSGMDQRLEDFVKPYKEEMTIHLVFLESNGGITAALNKGLELIQNEGRFQYIARIDAGDINLDGRFQKQLDFLKSHRTIYLCASYVRFTDTEQNEIYVFRPPSEPEKLRKVVHVYNPFIHPAVMFRSEIIEEIGKYPYDYPALEDHAYFLKVAKRFDCSIVEEILLNYEMNPEGISLSRRNVQTRSRMKLFYNEFSFGIYPIYGLIRSFFTYMIPRKILTMVKKLIH